MNNTAINIPKEEFQKYIMFHWFICIFALLSIYSFFEFSLYGIVIGGFMTYLLYRVIKSYDMPVANIREFFTLKSKRFNILNS